MASIFDFNAISDTVYKGAIPNPNWVMVPAGEYVGQISRIDAREVEGKSVQETFVVCELTWEIIDEEAKKVCNMEHPTARQTLWLRMVKDAAGNNTNQLDLGLNQNMPLKAVWEACGIVKDMTINKLKNQTAWIRVEHSAMMRDREQILDDLGRPMYRAEVVRVTSLEAAQAARRRANGGP